MVVQHNLTAMNSNRMLGVTTSTQAKSTEKLSSGYKINQAEECTALKEMLLSATELLSTNGRLSIITYHSLEDRMVKNIIKTGNVEGKKKEDIFGRVEAPLRPLSNKVITPDDNEIQDNPRSRSAKLRIGIKQ